MSWYKTYLSYLLYLICILSCIQEFITTTIEYMYVFLCFIFSPELKQKVTALSTENSELKIKIDELKVAHQREAKSREDLQIHYQQRLREKQKEIDNFRK